MPNTNLLPSSTLPASLFPPDELLSLPPLPQRSASTQETDESTVPDHPRVRVTNIRTPVNKFGLYKIFRNYSLSDMPHDPDSSVLPEDLREHDPLPIEESSARSLSNAPRAHRSDFHPFPNVSSYRLGEWYWSDDGGKSQQSFRDLVTIIGSDDFSPADIRDANWKDIDRLLASSAYDVDDMDSKEWIDDGISWRTASLTLRVPFSRYTATPGNHPFTVDGFHYRPLVPIIREKLASSSGREYFHTLGHELRWNPGPEKEHVRVYGEMYTSPAFLQAYEELQVGRMSPWSGDFLTASRRDRHRSQAASCLGTLLG